MNHFEAGRDAKEQRAYIEGVKDAVLQLYAAAMAEADASPEIARYTRNLAAGVLRDLTDPYEPRSKR